MGSKIMSVIMGLISILLTAVMIVFGFLIYDSIIKKDTVGDVKEFVSNITTVSSGKSEQDASTTEVLNTTLEQQNFNGSQKETTTSGRFFYNQLDNYSKTIYDAINKNKENMKTGTYEINLGQDFANLAANNNSQEIMQNYYQEAVDAYVNDNPEIFYIDFTKLYLNVETTTKGSKKSYRAFLNEGKGTSYLLDEFSTINRVNSAINEVEQVKNYIVQNKKNSDFQNIKMVHDYLVDNAEYEQTLSKPNIRNLYGALIDKSCVCEGYAEAFKYLMDALNVQCVIVSGTATNSQGQTENHAWNYVQLDGIWYAVDCTWDDPIIIGNGKLSDSVKYQYFLKGANEFNGSHIVSGQISSNGKNFSYPELSVQNYKY